jgi:hypothetical protein
MPKAAPVCRTPGDIHGHKPYRFIGIGDIHGPTAYKFRAFGDIHGPKAYKFMGFGIMYTNPSPAGGQGSKSQRKIDPRTPAGLVLVYIFGVRTHGTFTAQEHQCGQKMCRRDLFVVQNGLSLYLILGSLAWAVSQGLPWPTAGLP